MGSGVSKQQRQVIRISSTPSASPMVVVVVFNCGSSSLSYKAYEVARSSPAPTAVASGKAHRVGCAGTQPPFIEHKRPGATPSRDERRESTVSHAAAAAAILDELAARGVVVGAAGHRFVHGGTLFTGPALISPWAETRERLVRCLPLAPIHNPISLAVIDVCREKLGEAVPQYVVFDTAFHSTIEPRAYTYALPASLVEEHGYRKFGFHGLSYQYVMGEMREKLGSLAGTKIIACHLGTGGSSAAAVRDGRSVDTTMGWSPLPGLVMSTRTGDIDATVALSLVGDCGMTVARATKVLNSESGLTGLTGGLTSDLRDVHAIAADASNPHHRTCALAWEVYVHRLCCAVGSLTAAMEGITALVFTDDLGFDMPPLREAVCARLGWLGVVVDPAANAAATRASISASSSPVAEITGPQSRVRVFAVVNDEEIVIANEAAKLIFH
eukprot:m51a1_g5669 PPi-dependent acetate kinase (442) ;mRNA; r:924571-926108